MKEPWTTMGAGDAQFPLTRLSLLARAGADAPKAAREAAGVLFESYWKPLYAYLRAKGRRNEEAKDLTQSFCAHMVEKELFRRYDSSQGKFRAYLLGCLKNFVGDEDDRNRARKRGAGKQPASLDERDEGHSEPSSGVPSPEEEYERAWARDLLDRAFQRWKNDLTARGKQKWLPLAELLRSEYGQLPPIAELANQLETTEAQVRHFLQREAKDRLRKEAIAEIREETGSDKAAEEELNFLLARLAAPRARARRRTGGERQ